MEIYIRGLASGYEPEHVARLFFSARAAGETVARTRGGRRCGAAGQKNVLYAACA